MTIRDPAACPPIKQKKIAGGRQGLVADPAAADLDFIAETEKRLGRLPQISTIPAGLGGGLGGLPRVRIPASHQLARWFVRLSEALAPQLSDPLRTKDASTLIANVFYPYSSSVGLAETSGGPLVRMPRRSEVSGLTTESFAGAVAEAWQETILSTVTAAFSPERMEDPNTELLANLMAMTCGVASVPLSTIRCGIHGTAAVQDFSATLTATIREATRKVTEFRKVLEGPTSVTATEITRITDVLVALDEILDAKSVFVREFDRAVRAQPPRLMVAPPLLRINRDPVADEIYFGRPSLWGAVRDLDRRVREAGFVLFVIAATNQFGGRHPPHRGHNTGREVDLDWGFNSEPTEKHLVPNLVPGEFVDLFEAVDDPDPANVGRRLVFSDMKGDRPQVFRPRAGAVGPVTQAFGAKLATWVVLQGAVLAGFSKLLYSDRPNFLEAFEHLRRGLELPERQVRRLSVDGAESIAEIEPQGHFNHLHAEVSEQGPESWVTKEVEAAMQKLAEARDKDDDFYKTMFGSVCSPEERGPKSPSDNWTLATKLRWCKFNAAVTHPLLPIWSPLPKDAKKP